MCSYITVFGESKIEEVSGEIMNLSATARNPLYFLEKGKDKEKETTNLSDIAEGSPVISREREVERKSWISPLQREILYNFRKDKMEEEKLFNMNSRIIWKVRSNV